MSAHVYFLARSRSHTNPDLRRLSDANQSCDGPNVDESRLTSFAVERTSNLQIGARLLVFWVCSHLALNKHWGVRVIHTLPYAKRVAHVQKELLCLGLGTAWVWALE